MTFSNFSLVPWSRPFLLSLILSLNIAVKIRQCGLGKAGAKQTLKSINQTGSGWRLRDDSARMLSHYLHQTSLSLLFVPSWTLDRQNPFAPCQMVLPPGWGANQGVLVLQTLLPLRRADHFRH